MKSKLPILSAGVLLAAAILAAAGGVWLAWQPVAVRAVSDRTVLQTLSGELQQEMNRLELLLEQDLLEITEIPVETQSILLREGLGRLQGAAEVTHLSEDLSSRPTRVRSSSLVLPPPPEVTWRGTGEPTLGQLERMTLLGYVPGKNRDEVPFYIPPARSWERSPGAKWAFFWQRRILRARQAEAIVVTVHVPSVVRVINEHLQAWLVNHFAPVAALKGFDVVQSPDGILLAGRSGGPNPTADFIMPLSSPWGQWQLVSHDRVELKPAWNAAVLTITALVAGVLALVGVLAYWQLRRVLRQAEERVTFVNRVSHDLGTPLTNMMLNLDLAKDSMEADPQDCTARLEIVSEEGRRLARLVENVLSFSRHGQTPTPLKAVRCVPDGLIRAVIQQFEAALRRRGITAFVQSHTAESVMMDPDAFTQILANLVSNVEKYAANGGVLEVQSAWSEGRLRVSVEDAGPGILGADRERIFAPFCRLSSRVNEGASGTGLGLAIARDLARRMGGELHCLDCPRGALFQLDVPAPALHPNPTAP